MSFEKYIFLIIVSIISSTITGCYKPIDPSETPKIVSQEPSVFTGLPDEILNNTDFRAFISNKNGSIDKKLLPFSRENSYPFNLEPMRDGKNEISGFDTLGNPVFGGSDKDYGPKGIGYSPDKRYVLEIVSDEPDTFVYLWDIKEKKFYQVASCGTVGEFIGFSWLDSDRFIIWGICANPKEDWTWEKGSIKFVQVFHLKYLTFADYSSQIIPFEIMPYGKEKAH